MPVSLIGGDTQAQQRGNGVVQVLVGRAVVIRNALGPRLVRFVDEAWTAAPR